MTKENIVAGAELLKLLAELLIDAIESLNNQEAA